MDCEKERDWHDATPEKTKEVLLALTAADKGPLDNDEAMMSGMDTRSVPLSLSLSLQHLGGRVDELDELDELESKRKREPNGGKSKPAKVPGWSRARHRRGLFALAFG